MALCNNQVKVKFFSALCFHLCTFIFVTFVALFFAYAVFLVYVPNVLQKREKDLTLKPVLTKTQVLKVR